MVFVNGQTKPNASIVIYNRTTVTTGQTPLSDGEHRQERPPTRRHLKHRLSGSAVMAWVAEGGAKLFLDGMAFDPGGEGWSSVDNFRIPQPLPKNDQPGLLKTLVV